MSNPRPLHVSVVTMQVTVTSNAPFDDVQEVLEAWLDNASYVQDAVTDSLENSGYEVTLVTLGDDPEYHIDTLARRA